MTIFLDIDGVCADFTRHALSTNGLSLLRIEELISSWPKGEFATYKVAGIEENQFWKNIEARLDFWDSIPAYPWFHRLYLGLAALAPVVFLTSPSEHPISSGGKHKWITDRFGKDFKNFIICPASKGLLADKSAILVDDNDDNVEEFRKEGGKAILFPQPWNSGEETVDNVERVLNKAKQLVGGHK